MWDVNSTRVYNKKYREMSSYASIWLTTANTTTATTITTTVVPASQAFAVRFRGLQ